MGRAPHPPRLGEGAVRFAGRGRPHPRRCPGDDPGRGGRGIELERHALAPSLEHQPKKPPEGTSPPGVFFVLNSIQSFNPSPGTPPENPPGKHSIPLGENHLKFLPSKDSIGDWVKMIEIELAFNHRMIL